MIIAWPIAVVLCTAAAAAAEPEADAAATRTLISQVVVDAPPAEVWKAWTTEEGLESWLDIDVDMDLGLGRGGGQLRWNMTPGEPIGGPGTTIQHILFYQPERTIAFRPEVGGEVPFCKPCFEKTWTVVRLESIPPGSTRVVLEANGFKQGAEWDHLYDFFKAGNAEKLQKLRQKFARPAAASVGDRSTFTSIELGATPHEVFNCFKTPQGLVKILSVAQADVEFRIGGQIRTRYDQNGKIGEPGTITNTILAFEPDRMLALKPAAPDGASDAVRAFCETGWSIITLEPVGSGRTRLSVSCQGFGQGALSDQAMKFFDAGNKWTCEKMSAVFPVTTAQGADAQAAGDDDSLKVIQLDRFVAAGSVATDLHKEAVMKLTPDQAFDLWTSPAGFKKFLGVDSNVDLRIGGPMELFFGPGNPKGERGSDGCQILSYLPGRMLSFSWNAPPKFPQERQKRTWVVVLFHAQPDGTTKVEFNHLGFGPHGEGQWDEVRGYFDRAWGNVLNAMVEYAEKNASADGRSR